MYDIREIHIFAVVKSITTKNVLTHIDNDTTSK